MESRRLIKFGKNSHVLSLPKSWVSAHGLKKGDELFIEQKPGALVIMANTAEQEERTARINVDGMEMERFETEITSYYKGGYTTIIIEGKDFSAMADHMKEFVHNLAGLEIVEQSLTKMVVKDLIDIRQIAPPTLITRIDMMIRSMFQDALDERGVSADVLRSRDRDINRLQLLVTRTMRGLLEKPAMANILGISPPDAYALDRVAWTLERIGDYLKRMDGDILRSQPAVRKRLRKQLASIQELYLTTMKAYNRLDRNGALSLHQDVVHRLATFTGQVHKASQKDELLALENAKNILRDLRMILRASIEMAQRRGEGKEAKA